MNRAIKDATVKRYHYNDHDRLTRHMTNFIRACNFGRRLKTLKGLTPYEFICKCWTSEPERFIVNPIRKMPGLNIQALIVTHHDAEATRFSIGLLRYRVGMACTCIRHLRIWRRRIMTIGQELGAASTKLLPPRMCSRMAAISMFVCVDIAGLEAVFCPLRPRDLGWQSRLRLPYTPQRDCRQRDFAIA